MSSAPDVRRRPAITAAQFWAVARRPRWLAALALCLAIAGGFAALGQWQIQRSVDNATVVEIDTETAVPLAEIASTGSGVSDPQLGRMVSVAGGLVDGDYVLLTGRNDGQGGSDHWIVGHLVTPEGDSVAVAVGTTTEDAPPATLDAARDEWVGRYFPSEEPQASDFEHGRRSALSIAELVNLWAEHGPVYGGYIVLADPVPGLGDIRAPAPDREIALNWLNVFYAIEWVLFAGFAIYLWYRLVRDVVERRIEDAQAESAQVANVD